MLTQQTVAFERMIENKISEPEMHRTDAKFSLQMKIKRKLIDSCQIKSILANSLPNIEKKYAS